MAISFAFPKPKKPFSVVPWSPTSGTDNEFGLMQDEAAAWARKTPRIQQLQQDVGRAQRNRIAEFAPAGLSGGYVPGMISGSGNPAQAAQPNMAYPQAAQAMWEQKARDRAAATAANEALRQGIANAPLGQVFGPTIGGLTTNDRTGNFNQFITAAKAARDAIAAGGNAEIPVWSEKGKQTFPGWDSNPARQAAARAAWDNELEGRRAAVREKAWGREAARQGRLGNPVGATPQELAVQTSPFGQTERGRVMSAYGPQGMAAYDAPTIAQYQAEAMGGRNRTARFVQAYRATKAAGGTDEEALKAGLQAENMDEQTGLGNPLISGTRNPSIVPIAEGGTNIPQSELTPVSGYGRGEFVKTPDGKVYKVDYDPKAGKVLKKPKGNPLVKNSTIPSAISNKLTSEQQAEIKRLEKEGEEANRIRNMGFWEQLWRTSRPAEWLGQGLPPKYQWFK